MWTSNPRLRTTSSLVLVQAHSGSRNIVFEQQFDPDVLSSLAEFNGHFINANNAHAKLVFRDKTLKAEKEKKEPFCTISLYVKERGKHEVSGKWKIKGVGMTIEKAAQAFDSDLRDGYFDHVSLHYCWGALLTPEMRRSPPPDLLPFFPQMLIVPSSSHTFNYDVAMLKGYYEATDERK